MPRRGNSTGKGLEVSKGQHVTGELRDAEGEYRGEAREEAPQKRAGAPGLRLSRTRAPERVGGRRAGKERARLCFRVR